MDLYTPQKLSRKKKKELKKMQIQTLSYYFPLYGDRLSKYNQVDFYKDLKKFYNKSKHLLKYHKALDYIFIESEEPSYINENGELCFQAEDYNGLYTYTEEVRFYYNEKDTGDTWSLEVIIGIVSEFTQDYDYLPKEITNDLSLLKFIDKQLIKQATEL